MVMMLVMDMMVMRLMVMGNGNDDDYGDSNIVKK